MNESWENELERLGSGVRPVAAAAPTVVASVRRRRRRRTAGAVLGAGAGVAAVVVTLTLASGSSGTTDGAPRPAATSSKAPLPPYTLAQSDTCDFPVDPVPALADEAEQEALAARTEGVYARFVVVKAVPSPIGVIAMVTGNVDAARATLTEVSAVSEWYGEEAELESYLGPIQQALQPLQDRVETQLPDEPGLMHVLPWQEAGAAVIQWKAPIPPEVEALAGETDGRLTVWVRPTAYSEADLRAAQERLDIDFPDGLTYGGSSPCIDGAGLRVNVSETPDDLGAAEEAVGAIAGVRVYLETGASESVEMQDADFTCQDDFEEPQPPPIGDLDEQQALVNAALVLDSDDFTVRDAQVTALGAVVAVERDLAAAKAAMPDVPFVVTYSLEYEQLGAGLVTQQQLEPVKRELLRAAKGRDGFADLAYLTEAGAMQSSWKAPVPADIAALEGPRPGGAFVVVRAVPYSTADLQAATDRLFDGVDNASLVVHGAQVTSSSHCYDGSGLVVGINPPIVDGPTLQVELADRAGMPVMLIEDHPDIGF